jgi:hypothetical protein
VLSLFSSAARTRDARQLEGDLRPVTVVAVAVLRLGGLTVPHVRLSSANPYARPKRTLTGVSPHGRELLSPP